MRKKIEVIKNKSWFLMQIMGVKLMQQNPKIRAHLAANKPVKLTVEIIDDKQETVDAYNDKDAEAAALKEDTFTDEYEADQGVEVKRK